MLTMIRAGIDAWPTETNPNVQPRFREVIHVSRKVIVLFDSGAMRPWQPCRIYA
ncbi:hypothetical protein ZWY2020_043858 [Hordeum vulgare]|nr:hypothetical protein ZWY2020_043858 [Hordeum vulgare]